MKKQKLTSKQREFFNTVSGAVFANPFSENRFQIDSKIAGVSGKKEPMQILHAALEKIRAELAALDKQGVHSINDFSDEDQEIVSKAHLFDIFHLCMDDFDKLIINQLEAGDTPCEVPFANDILNKLLERGFSKKDACLSFGMFFQLRRAFFFISGSLLGESKSMKHLRLTLWNNVFTHDMRLYAKHLWNRMEDFSTLLLGETGTGKGAAATAIGRSGFIPFDDRKMCFTESFTRSFRSINLSQFPESLIESELFGHKKGAFTGAVEAYQGIFERCSPHGAIFLDEIGDVSIPVQIKLLNVLQERFFSPVGSHEKRRFNGRVIAASNKSINDLRREKLFRDDFFYRLCSDVITVPPLAQRIRENKGELQELLGLTLERIIGEQPAELCNLVLSVIDAELGKNYAWPGNVRELEQCARRILLTHSYKGDHQSAGTDLRAQIDTKITKGECTAQELLSAYCTLLYKQHGTYEEVARRTDLDRRTVRKYVG